MISTAQLFRQETQNPDESSHLLVQMFLQMPPDFVDAILLQEFHGLLAFLSKRPTQLNENEDLREHDKSMS